MQSANQPGVITVIPRTQPLLRGKLVSRYKRFFADVQLDNGETIISHCVNTGTMEGLTRPGTRVWVSESDNPKRKLKYTWELAEMNGEIIGVNTSLPNKIVHRLLQEKQLPWLAHWENVRPEKPYGENSRVDFWLTGGQAEHYLEVKNCHLVYPDEHAYFPDCVSTRAAGHLHELCACIQNGNGQVTAEVLFFAQMPNARALRPSDLHDPVFARTSREVAGQGVRFSAIGIRHTEESLEVYGPLPVDLHTYDTSPLLPWRAANKG